MPVIGDQVGLTVDQIVLATDFSPASDKATGYAEGLARRFSASLALAHVVDLSVATPAEAGVVVLPIEQMRHTSDEYQRRLMADLKAEGIRSSAHTVEAFGPAASLVALANELNADLIVTGTNARHGLSKAILGSCAEAIIRHASCPVLTVGPKAKPAPKQGLSFHTILFATDFSVDAARQAEIALSFAQDSAAKLYLCHVLKEPGADISQTLNRELHLEAELEKLLPESSYDWCDHECIVEIGKVAPHVLELAGKIGADLIVLGAKPSSTWFGNIIEGTVGKVLANAECPVMTICSERESAGADYLPTHRSEAAKDVPPEHFRIDYGLASATVGSSQGPFGSMSWRDSSGPQVWHGYV